MRLLMHALVGLLVVANAVAPASAELQWIASGVQQDDSVQQASHAAPTRRPANAKPVGKAPSMVRQASAPAAPARQPVKQAVATAPRANASASQRVDRSVQPVVGQCGCVGGCECGGPPMPYYDEPACACGDPGCGFADPGCGFADPGCGIVEPGCGLSCGAPCDCGDVGCCGECAVGCGDLCGPCGVPVVLCLPPIRELTFFGGVQGFKNPLDGAGRDSGNFGFNTGVNVGGAMSWLGIPALGYQLGYRATFNQLHGDADAVTSDGHNQSFFTGGLFHRKACGLQYGVVYDLLQDERQTNADYGQIRGLISVTNPRGHEIGFQFASKTNENIINNTTYSAANQYLLFYRQHGCQGGEFRVFVGGDDNSKGILGADFSVPLTNRWSLETGFTYLIPEDDTAGVGAQQEGWNVGMNMVWHYGKRAKQSYMSQYRPMFNVADNGVLIVDDQN